MTRVLWGLVISVILLGGGHVVWSHEAKAPYQKAVRAYSQHRDAEALDAVKRALSIYPNYAEAHKAWQKKARETIDHAEMRYFIVHLHRLLDPEQEGGGRSG